MSEVAVVGRQSILDKNNKVFAYEILYRSYKNDKTAVIKNNVYATSRVLVNLFVNIGIENIVGNKLAFINVDDKILLSKFDFEKVVPSDKVVLEILESTKVSEELIQRIKHLKTLGYSLALDDFEIGQETKKLIKYVDYIKVDVLNIQEKHMEEIIKLAKGQNIKLLAEKVEDRETFEKFKKLGFDFFQGYFFSKPRIVSAKKLTPKKLILLNILSELSKDDPNINKVEESMKSDINITVNILKFINSAYFSLKGKVKSVRHAINLLGPRKLKNWVLLFIYANEFEEKIEDNPSFDLAIIRGKILEELSFKVDNISSEEAYFLGLLSLIDVILGISKEEIFSELPLKKEIRDAVLLKNGLLGNLLLAIENYELENYKKVEELLTKYGLSLKDVFEAEYKAIKYNERTKQLLKN